MAAASWYRGDVDSLALHRGAAETIEIVSNINAFNL
jgi:hypothetical protein